MADNNLTREGSDNFNKYNPTVSGDAAWQAAEAQLEAQSRAGKSPNPYNPGASAPLSSKVMSNTLDASDFGIPFTVTPAPPTSKGRSTRKGK